MKIIQIVPGLFYGDAVGNDVLALNKLLNSLNIETKIYAIDIGNRIPVGIADSFYDMPVPEKDDMIIYHLSIGCKIIRDYLLCHACRKVMIYHNITPVHFFNSYRDEYQYTIEKVLEGFEDLQLLKNTFEACIADSEFNKQDLRVAGYTCPIAVLPILVPFEDYEQEPDAGIISRYRNDGWKNILFVGRIAPNKCQEDVILSFAAYKKLYNAKSRLFIVGNYNGMGSYYNRLQEYVEVLGVQDVIFTGHIPFKEILAYYRLADAFLCMSEHEGFCVPLLEAMKFEIPIIAYSSTAIPHTLGDSGIKLSSKNPNLVAAVLDEVICNKRLREELLSRQKNRLAYFQYDNVAQMAEQLIMHLQKHENIETEEILSEPFGSNVEQLLPGLEEKISGHAKTETFKPFKDIPVPRRKNEIHTVRTGRSFVRNYYEQVYSQSGIRAFVKRKIFGNLLNVLLAQENYIAELENRLTKLEEQPENNAELLVRDNPALLIDVTFITKTDLGTGIQRVVNNFFRTIYEYKDKKNVIPVRAFQRILFTSKQYFSRLYGVNGKKDLEVSFQKGDQLLLLDSSWDYANDFSHILTLAKSQDIKIHAVIYDMLPVMYPDTTILPEFVKNFCAWHNMIMQKSDSVLCISRTTADVVAQYYEKMKFKRNSPLNLYYFHMGADVPGGIQEARDEIQDFVKSGKTFLMVGTLEPRKGHMVALQAFSKILKGTNNDCRLLIIGHNGWKNDEIRKQLALPEYKDKVLWIEDATDAELRWAYAHSDALIAASKDEGFGLPLVEAAHFGLPIICSDIPIFREVTQGNADYFKVMDADDLARCMSEWLKTEQHPNSRNIRIYTWQESAQEILDIIDGKVEPYKVLE